VDEAVTASIRRRDEVIARQLVAVGATPAEAETYARETSVASGRIAPVDLRSFERERLGWLARRRGKGLAERRVVDRTGQPPSWQTRPGEAGPTPVASETALRPYVETSPAGTSAPSLAGDQLGAKLRGVLGGSRP
jgi:hypothetical protein